MSACESSALRPLRTTALRLLARAVRQARAAERLGRPELAPVFWLAAWHFADARGGS